MIVRYLVGDILFQVPTLFHKSVNGMFFTENKETFPQVFYASVEEK